MNKVCSYSSGDWGYLTLFFQAHVVPREQRNFLDVTRQPINHTTNMHFQTDQTLLNKREKIDSKKCLFNSRHLQNRGAS